MKKQASKKHSQETNVRATVIGREGISPDTNIKEASKKIKAHIIRKRIREFNDGHKVGYELGKSEENLRILGLIDEVKEQQNSNYRLLNPEKKVNAFVEMFANDLKKEIIEGTK